MGRFVRNKWGEKEQSGREIKRRQEKKPWAEQRVGQEELRVCV